MTQRKLALFIVEGGSDMSALAAPFRRLFREKGVSCYFECEVYGTDITLHEFMDESDSADPMLVMNRVSKAVDEFLTGTNNPNKYTVDDVGIVVTLSDLDCCYCDNSDLEFGGLGCVTLADCARRKYVCNDIAYIEGRNDRKRDAFGILSSEEKVLLSNGKPALFRSFYCGINLEHALYNDSSYHTQDEKSALAKQWAVPYRRNAEEFYKAISSIPRISNDYAETWDDRELRKRPFERISNLLQMIDWFLSLAQKIAQQS